MLIKVVTLAEATPLTVPGEVPNAALRPDPFALLFHGPLAPIAPQQIYEMNHPQLGKVEIFIVPIGPDKKTRQNMRYEAIFN